MDNDSIKRNIRKLRIENNLSMREMATIMGISFNAYRNIEKGATVLIDSIVFKMAEWARVSPEEIILGYNPYPANNGELMNSGSLHENSVYSDDPTQRLEWQKNEIDLLKAIATEKGDSINSLESLVALLEERLGE